MLEWGGVGVALCNIPKKPADWDKCCWIWKGGTQQRLLGVSDWLLMLLSRLGLVELTQPDITLSGLNPFELRQSREAQISKHIHACTHICACTHPHERIKREALHATEYAPVHCPPDTHTRICFYRYISVSIKPLLFWYVPGENRIRNAPGLVFIYDL